MFSLRGGIRKKLLISYVAIIIPLVLVILYMHYSRFLDKRQDIVTSRIAFARNVASSFDGFIKEVSTAEKALGLSIAGGDYTRPEASDYLSEIGRRYPFFEISYARTDGRIFASSNSRLIGTKDDHGEFSTESYIGRLTPGRDWYVSPLHSHHEHEPSFDIVTGIFRGNTLQGLVIASVDATRLNEVFDLEVPGGGYNITDNRGMVAFQSQRPQLALAQRDWSEHEFVKKTLAGDEFISFGLTFPADGSYRIGAQVPIAGVGWSAGSFVPVEEVLAAARIALFASSAAAALVVIFALGLAFMVGRNIVRPITSLAGKAKAIAAGSFDEEVDIIRTGDELEELSHSFDTMRLNLKDYVNELSGLVETGEKMNLALNIPFVENAVTNALRNYFDAKVVWVALYNERHRKVKVDHFWSEAGVEVEGLTRAPGDPAINKVLMTAKPLVIKDISETDFANKDVVLSQGIDSLILLPLVSGGGSLGIIEFYTPLIKQDRVHEKEITLLMALANQAAVAIENANLYEETRKSERQLKASNDDLRILNKLALDISSGLNLKELVEKIANSAIDLVSADVGSLILYAKETGKVECVYRSGAGLVGGPRVQASAGEADDLGLIDTALRIMKPVYTNDYQHDPRLKKGPQVLGINAVAVSPLLIGHRLIGVLQIALTGEKTFTMNDIVLLEAVSLQAAVAIENARLYEKERQVAETLQNALLATPDELSGIKAGVIYRSATDNSKVGGDFYDFIEFSDGRIGIVVGDVSGKGLEAAATTALVKMTVRAFAYEYDSPSEVLAHANSVISSQLPSGQFITIAYAVLDPETGAFSYASAGHPMPMIVNPVSKTVRQLRIGATPLGIVPNMDYPEYHDALLDGEIILLYTDGLLEARKGSILFGEVGISSALTENSDLDVLELPGRLLDVAQDFAEGTLSDDVAIVALRLDRTAKVTPIGESTWIRDRKDGNGQVGDWVI